jgi:hypothetical protein
MIRLMCICLGFFFLTSVAVGQERKNFSIDDVIDGFKKKNLFYFELFLEDGKYSWTFNKCLGSRPADFNWMKQYCKKNPDFKNNFVCSEDNKLTHVLYIHESQEKCEEIRELMKDKMDALKQ